MPPETEQWIPYFEYLASSSAALLGLAFVAVQISHTRLLSQPQIYQSETRTSLTELAAALFFSLIYLMPMHSWRWAGIIAGVMLCAAIVWQTVDYWQNYRPKHHRLDPARRFHFGQWLATLIILPITAALLQVPVDAARAGTALWLVFSGLSESWLILFGPHHRSEPPGPL